MKYKCLENFALYGIYYMYNESTAGADASVEVPKLHNIKLAFIHTLIINYYYHDEHLLFCCMQSTK